MRIAFLACLLWSQLALATTESYVAEALDVIERNAMAVPNVDWPAIRARALAAAREGGDRHDIVAAALKSLGDGHSFFMRPPASQTIRTPVTQRDRIVVDPATRIAYANLRGFVGTDRESMRAYTHTLRSELVASDACGYVIDLRRNPGGNMWPQLLALQPLLGNGMIGAFRFPGGRVVEWRIANEVTSEILHSDSGEPLPSADLRDKPVAVLLGTDTASSGEAVAIAFRGRRDTRSFGWHTASKTTANATFRLPDDAVMVITVADMLDRDGNTYQPYLAPDVETTAELRTRRRGRIADETRDTANRWLATHPSCAALDTSRHDAKDGASAKEGSQ